MTCELVRKQPSRYCHPDPPLALDARKHRTMWQHRQDNAFREKSRGLPRAAPANTRPCGNLEAATYESCRESTRGFLSFHLRPRSLLPSLSSSRNCLAASRIDSPSLDQPLLRRIPVDTDTGGARSSRQRVLNRERNEI